MPHIHTEPDQHDMTVSAYIVRKQNDEWKCLVHMHRRLGVLMQIGGHIELNESPWQAMAHELSEESGYALDELQILQYVTNPVHPRGAIAHPQPFLMNTHTAGAAPHYHSDICYAFIAIRKPRTQQAAGESADLRWYSVEELRAEEFSGESGERTGKVVPDVVDIYADIVSKVDDLPAVPATSFSLEKPRDTLGID